LDTENACDTTKQSGLKHKLPNLEFSTSIIKNAISFLSGRKLRVLVEGEMFTPSQIQAGMPQSSVLPFTFYSM
jgi:hypothetical protein